MSHAFVSPVKLFCALVLVFSCGLCWGQPGPLNASPSRLAPTKTPGKINIAVINMKNASGVSSGETEVISDRLRSELFNTGKVNVMERDQMQEILKEQGFQQSGACTNEACMVEIGQLLGVEQLITGSLGKVGSMFLVNLRVIDVKTAKIMKVVSVDIKGDLDEVVTKLPGVASQLVASEAPPQPAQPVTIEKKEEVKKEEPKPAAVEEKKEEPAQATAPEVSDERKEKNKNRTGIRAGVNLFGTRVTRIMSRTNSNPSYDDETLDFDAANQDSAKIVRTMLVNYYMKAAIRAGRFITVDIGGGYSHQETDYQWLSGGEETHVINIFSLPSLGVNFTKRWYPLKINAGLLADLNILGYSVGLHDPNNPDLFFMSVNAGFGFHTGLEIMAGKHVGFNADFVYYYSHFETFNQQETFHDNTGSAYLTTDFVWKLTMPPIALNLGVNFYF
jgi:TolB-like protein